jgi:dipicolinate synthase subunit A
MRMKICCAGTTAAARYAATALWDAGWDVTDQSEGDVEILLLDVPSFGANGFLRGGGDIQAILDKLPRDVTVCGGNLTHPALESYKKIDFLENEDYLAQNAYITAEAALDVALPYLQRTVKGCKVLILGWGRIGKCLGNLLKAMGAEVTVAARKASDRAMLKALGFGAVGFPIDVEILQASELIYNTVPYEVLDCAQIQDCTKIDLASRQGVIGDDVVIARGLQGIHFPESSGKLIANTLMRILRKEESS